MMLKDRILTKTVRRNTQAEADEYWLALFNDYWIAGFDSFQAAYNKLDIAHDFDEIYVIDGYERAEPLMSSN